MVPRILCGNQPDLPELPPKIKEVQPKDPETMRQKRLMAELMGKPPKAKAKRPDTPDAAARRREQAIYRRQSSYYEAFIIGGGDPLEWQPEPCEEPEPEPPTEMPPRMPVMSAIPLIDPLTESEKDERNRNAQAKHRHDLTAWAARQQQNPVYEEDHAMLADEPTVEEIEEARQNYYDARRTRPFYVRTMMGPSQEQTLREQAAREQAAREQAEQAARKQCREPSRFPIKKSATRRTYANAKDNSNTRRKGFC
jgi:hypothetical protein